MKNLTFFLLVLASYTLASQTDNKDYWRSENFSGLAFRSIGPALMSGRIADIAIHPDNENIWYIAVGSGGVWKTTNAGTTWTPIFDNESCYSTGCITLDPSDPNVIWLGTGENVGGRHVGFGDGVFRSTDGGASWTNMGLESAEHISKIIVHPTEPNTVWVAAQGPLWSHGGERGVYKTTDGGQNWKQTLGDNVWTGATDLLIDPRNPAVLYAATWDRHRTVAAYLGGGPGSGIHRSDDGGDNWHKLSSGLPTSNMGKIGIAISPQEPDVIYAAIELDRRKGGVYRSGDKGMTWSKMSDQISGGTGPHYYQELYACPHQFDRIYLMDVRIRVSDNGGKHFRRLSEKYKHSDNHAIAFKANDPDYLLVGSDGGLYESFDLAENWKFFDNLPLTQFYKIAVDDAEPFYNVYGGTQDNSTEGGPSRTDNVQGIQNGDWKIVLNWDGHQPACEPGNPNIMYGQRQQGTLSRIDLEKGEVIDIKPQAGPGEPYERFNWDAPILISENKPERIYFASHRVWKSEDRGDNWTAISEDLTRNENRLHLPIMGGVQSYDNPWDVYAMGTYNTIANIAVSPFDENIIYAGTDDGLIHMTADGGKTWTKKEVSSISGVPKRAYVNDIRADIHDKSTVYLAMDNHKEGDYRPYLYKSTDMGKTWKAITDGLSQRNLVWRIVQDHVDPELLFIGTEFGVYFTVNGGKKWTQLKGGLPTISFRDMKIQRRENDLICGSFGRSIYIYDDISAFREISEEQMDKPAQLFSTRDALWYIPKANTSFNSKKANLGSEHYVADNPEFGAVFTYYLKEGHQSLKERRKEEEKKAAEMKKAIQPQSWSALDTELSEDKDRLWLVISTASGDVVRRVACKNKKGFHRVAWDLRYPASQLVELNPRKRGEWDEAPKGILAATGTYTAQLVMESAGQSENLSEEVTFKVKPLHKVENIKEAEAFWNEYAELIKAASHFQSRVSATNQKLKAIDRALLQSNLSASDYASILRTAKEDMKQLDNDMNGSAAKREIGEKTIPTMGDRMFSLYLGIANSTYGPTGTHKDIVKWIKSDLSSYSQRLTEVDDNVKKLAELILAAGGPHIEGIDVR